MKNPLILAALAATLMIGCGSSSTNEDVAEAANTASAVQVAYDQGSIKKGDTAYCVVCVADEGKAVTEPVAETIDYKGKTYAFCNEGEKATFISSPDKYAVK